MRGIRVALGAAGLTGMAYAGYGAVTDDGVNIPGVLGFLAAVLIGHDLVVLPLAIGTGFLVVRYVPGWARPWVQAGLFSSAVVTVISIPLLVGAGRVADNPSRLPLDYGRGLLVLLGVIWLAMVAGALVTRWGQARTGADPRAHEVASPQASRPARRVDR